MKGKQYQAKGLNGKNEKISWILIRDVSGDVQIGNRIPYTDIFCQKMPISVIFLWTSA